MRDRLAQGYAGFYPGCFLILLLMVQHMASDAMGAVAAVGVQPVKDIRNPITLQPGTLVGDVLDYTVQPGDRISALAVRHGIHPIRITRTSGPRGRTGLQVGESLRIDRRHIVPTFPPGLTGLVLNLPEAELYLLKNGKLVKEYPVGVSSSQSRAPIGISRILNKEIDPTWYVPKTIQQEMRERGDIVKVKVGPGPQNPLGTRWLGFGNGSFGFHGTLFPTSIKHYASHGCVRMRRSDVEDLYTRVKVGLRVYVVYQPVLLATTPDGIHLCAYPDFYRSDYDYRRAIQDLAQSAGVTPHLDWRRIKRLIQRTDGIPVMVDKRVRGEATPPPATPHTGFATPRPIPTEHALPTPRPTRRPPTIETTPPSDILDLTPLDTDDLSPE